MIPITSSIALSRGFGEWIYAVYVAQVVLVLLFLCVVLKLFDGESPPEAGT